MAKLSWDDEAQRPFAARMIDTMVPDVVRRWVISHHQLSTAVRTILYVIRCTSATLIAYGVCAVLDLAFPIWGAVTGVIVASDSLSNTYKSAEQQIYGTLFGVVVGLVVGILGEYWQISVVVEIALSVAICALITARYALARMGMWGCLLVLLGARNDHDFADVAFNRAVAVMIGAIIGGAIHAFASYFVLVLTNENDLESTLD